MTGHRSSQLWGKGKGKPKDDSLWEQEAGPAVNKVFGKRSLIGFVETIRLPRCYQEGAFRRSSPHTARELLSVPLEVSSSDFHKMDYSRERDNSAHPFPSRILFIFLLMGLYYKHHMYPVYHQRLELPASELHRVLPNNTVSGLYPSSTV